MISFSEVRSVIDPKVSCEVTKDVPYEGFLQESFLGLFQELLTGFLKKFHPRFLQIVLECLQKAFFSRISKRNFGRNVLLEGTFGENSEETSNELEEFLTKFLEKWLEAIDNRQFPQGSLVEIP